MSVYDALEAWQSGDITAARAMQLTGAADVMELYAFAYECDVGIRTLLLPRETEQAKQAIAFIETFLRQEQAQDVSQEAEQAMSAK